MRNSSIELYRIIATLTVLIVHYNGWFVGLPQGFDYANPSLFRIGQMIIEAATIICVNMFLIITGYFGVRLKFLSVLKICLLLLFIYVPFNIINSALNGCFSIKSLIGCFFVISRSGYFIQGYLMLMFFSPVLNSFVDKYSPKQVLGWTTLFFIIEFWFDCIMEAESLGFGKGFSVTHFLLMYFVGRCIFLYKDILINRKRLLWVVGYLICTLLICACYMGHVRFAYKYSNPLVVLSSVCSFVPFLYKVYYNKVINSIAAVTLPVYIIQIVPPANDFLIWIDHYLLNEYTYLVYLLISSVVLTLFFVGCIVYGKIIEIPIRFLIGIADRRLNALYARNGL